MSTKNVKKQRLLLSHHLKLVAKLTLYTSLVAAVVLLFVLFMIKGPEAGSYADLIRSYTITRQNLWLILLLSGLAMLVLIGGITWLVCLYSSSLVAGPVYRFARNLEAATKAEPVLKIRSGDALQEVSDQLISCVDNLNKHYSELDGLVDQALAALEKDEDGEFKNAIKALEERVEMARL